MGWTLPISRKIGKAQRFRVEALESRQLLSTIPTATQPAAELSTPTPAGTPSGSVSGTDFNSITGAAQLRATYGVDGTGSSVAVIDTGVNYLHPALGGGFGPGHKVIAGYDFAQNNGDPLATWQHGTAVAGLIASSDPSHLGIAPGANIVALRVFGNDNRGDFNRVADALQWVIDNHDRYNITVVNISLSDGNNYTINWFANDGGVGQRITSLVHQLDQLNIPVVTATGNSFSGQQGQGFTSIIADSISVTATDSGDHLVANAQRLGKAAGGAQATDIAAPGTNMVAPSDGSNFSAGDGTSFAAPIVSGSIVLLQQVYKARFGQLPTVEQVDGWLQSGADLIHDSVTGIDIGRIDDLRAAALIPAAPTPPAQQVLAPTPIAAPMPAPAPTPPPAPTPSPAPPAVVPAAPPVQASKPSTVVTEVPSGEIFYNGRALSRVKSDRISEKFSSLFESVLNGQVKNVRIWGSSVSSAAPTQSNSFARAGLTSLTNQQTWQATTISSAHPTGHLRVGHSALGHKHRSH